MTTLASPRRAGTRLAARRASSPRPASRPDRAAMVHLSLLGAVLAAAVFAAGGRIPQVWLACELAVGLLAASWAAINPSSSSSRWGRFRPAVVLLPLYAAMQAVPLPLALMDVLSPARAELHNSVAAVVPRLPPWVPLSVHPEATLDFALRLAAYAAVYWTVCGLAVRFARKPFVLAAPIVCVAAAQAAIVLAQHAAGEPAAGSYINRNHVAGLLEMALPFVAVAAVVAWRFRGGRGALHVAAGGALTAGVAALILGAILATGSRGGLAAALVSLLAVGLAALRRRASGCGMWAAAAVLLLLLGAAFVYLPSENLVRRYGNVVGGEALRLEGRVLLWSETLDLIADYPLAGCGFGAFEAAFLRYKRSAPMVADPHAHNDYLELLAEGGLIGFALCVVLAVRPVFAAIRTSAFGDLAGCGGLAVACVGSLAAILAHGLVDFNLRIPANGMVFVWVLGLCNRTSGEVSSENRLGRSEPHSQGWGTFPK